MTQKNSELAQPNKINQDTVDNLNPILEIDKGRIRKYDPAWNAFRRWLIIILTIVVICSAIATGLLMLKSWWAISAIIPLAADCVMIILGWKLIVYSRKGRFQMYRNLPLCHAVMCKENPATALAIVNLNTEQNNLIIQTVNNQQPKPTYGICLIELGQNGDWKLKIGDHIPCRYTLQYPDYARKLWTQFNAIPLIWASKNQIQIQACLDILNKHQWELLRKLIPLTPNLNIQQIYTINADNLNIQPMMNEQR